MVEKTQEQVYIEMSAKSEESNIKTILQDKQDTYENKVRDFIRAGFHIVNCGVFVSYSGTFWWWAMLQKDGKEKAPEGLLSDLANLRVKCEEAFQLTNQSRSIGSFGYADNYGSMLLTIIGSLQQIEETYQ